MRRPNLAFLIVLAVLLSACAVHQRATDPSPTLPSLTEVAPLPAPPSQSPLPESALPAPEPRLPGLPPALRAAPKQVKSAVSVETPPRVWGRVAITTAVVSPAQLMGPEIPYAPEYRRLPVFPEKLTFDVSWGLLSVGEATMGVDKLVIFNGRPAYHLVSEARSNSFCDTFYPVRDLNESWLDARTLTSLGYSKKLREGRFFRDVWVLYDRDAGTFIERTTNRDDSFRIRIGTIPAQVQDVLSSVFFVRAHELPDGGSVVVDVNTPDNWPLVVAVQKRETAKVPAGTFPAVVVEPAMRKEGLFIQKGRRLRLWLSDDAARRPLRMKVEVFFGHVTAVLREML